MDFKEALNNRYSSILPACAIFNGTDDSLNFGKPAVISGINTSDFYLAVRFRLPANPSTQCLVAGCDINGATTTTRFGIGIGTNGKPFWHLTFGAGLDLSYNYVDSVADGKLTPAIYLPFLSFKIATSISRVRIRISSACQIAFDELSCVAIVPLMYVRSF